MMAMAAALAAVVVMIIRMHGKRAALVWGGGRRRTAVQLGQSVYIEHSQHTPANGSVSEGVYGWRA